MSLPKQGIYRHYKGKCYELLEIATHSETMEQMVVYRALYGTYDVWVRPLSMWSELIEINGGQVPRFSPEFESGEAYFAPVKSETVQEKTFIAFQDKYAALKQMYGYDTFRSGQEEIVDALLAGKDAMVVMPTGAGKSICYQIPALMLNGVTLVISPLISLMKDQVQTLCQNGIPAAYLNSSLTERQLDLAMQNVARGKYRIIYIAPERLMTSRFLSIAQTIPISMVAVDEAHCISQWGQDFRPSYLSIPEFIRQLPSRPIICAFTATATENVRKDICNLLHLQNPYQKITGFDRKNLYYGVLAPDSKDKALLDLLKSYKGLPGIVYCATRKKVESVCELLQANGYSVTRYHAGLTDVERQANQEDFTYDRREIMVATNAFGMGINKSNVRFIIHYNMPKDIESYYQEAGRAGRDGERADCHLLFHRQDIMTQQFFIDHMGEEAGLEGEELRRVQDKAKRRLSEMIRYCETPQCLRKHILQYFGEKAEDTCGFCLNCLNPPQLQNMTSVARAVVQCVEETREHFGKGTIVDILRGAETERIRQFRLQNVLSYGAARNLSREQIGRILDRLVELKVLRVGTLETANGSLPILELGTKSEEIFEGTLEVTILDRPTKKEKIRSKRDHLPEGVDRDLYDHLVALRRRIAYARGIPPYIVFPDSVLRSLAAIKPKTQDEMAKISGIGVIKLRDFGQTFLKEIRKYEEK